MGTLATLAAFILIDVGLILGLLAVEAGANGTVVAEPARCFSSCSGLRSGA
jgi:hypothetical protein